MVQMSAYVRTVVLFRFITIPAATVVVPCASCPKEMWMDARREDVLDAPYFHTRIYSSGYPQSGHLQ